MPRPSYLKSAHQCQTKFAGPAAGQRDLAGRRSDENDRGYAERVATERETYRDCLDVHNLPAVFHYWSNRYVRPNLEAFGFSTPDEMFRKYAVKQFQDGERKRRIASLGAGNCQLEVDLTLHLLDKGNTDFVIDCLELNTDMLERGRNAAAAAGTVANLNFVQSDLNTWSAAHEYDVIIANQAIHHVLNLENLFTEIEKSLKPGGSFVISDMIGRNGHQRWPEALDLVREFWRKLPPSYRFNHSLLRYEETYENWDCSGESFEGIRSQDILPLLNEHFHFELFIAFANIIDPFVDRAFGGNFDPAEPWDRGFIDQVNERDEKEIASGLIKPTHLLAVMGTDPGVPTIFREALSPEFCFRDPSRATVAMQPATGGESAAYEWRTWPHSDRRELEVACRRLKEAQDRTNNQAVLITERTQWARRLDREMESAAQRVGELHNELNERTEWAQRLNREIESAAQTIGELHHELNERTAWAQRLDREREELLRELRERTMWAEQLERELEDRGAWINRLDEELKQRALVHGRDLDRLAWAGAIDRHFHTSLDSTFRLVRRVVRRVRRLLV